MSTPYEPAGAQPRRHAPATPSSLPPGTSSRPASPRRSRTPPRPPSISRTTAYRYFPNKRALLVAAHPEIAATSMLPANPPQDPGGPTRRRRPQLQRHDPRHRGAAANDAAPLARGRSRRTRRAAPSRRDARSHGSPRRSTASGVTSPTNSSANSCSASAPPSASKRSSGSSTSPACRRNDAVALTRWSAQALLQQATTLPPPTPTPTPRQSGKRHHARQQDPTSRDDELAG